MSAKNAYESASSEWSTRLITETITSSAYIPELDTDVPYTTLCDGVPRAVVTSSTTNYETYDPPRTRTVEQWQVSGAYRGPSPTCTIAQTACSTLIASYDSAISDWQTNAAPSPTLKPQCATSWPSCNPDGKDQCQIWGYGGNIYYWPVTTTMGDFCAYNGSTIFASPTNPPSPNTVVMDGYTFTSPTNYASFPYFQAFLPTTRGRKYECGPRSYEDIIVPITESFYSFGGPDGTRTFNFEDLNTVPVSAYVQQRKCLNGLSDCKTIEGQYYPQIPLPTEILNLEPKEWKEANCYGRPGISGKLFMTPVPLITPAPTAPGN